MVKTSKSVPQNSTLVADTEAAHSVAVPKLYLKEFIPRGYSIDNDFKVEKVTRSRRGGEEHGGISAPFPRKCSKRLHEDCK